MSSVHLFVLNSGEMDSWFSFLFILSDVNSNYVESVKKWRLFFGASEKVASLC